MINKILHIMEMKMMLQQILNKNKTMITYKLNKIFNKYKN